MIQAPRFIVASVDIRTHWMGQTNAHPIRTLNAPSGVTRIAGAKAYAAKLAISPRTTAIDISIKLYFLKQAPRTSYE